MNKYSLYKIQEEKIKLAYKLQLGIVSCKCPEAIDGEEHECPSMLINMAQLEENLRNHKRQMSYYIPSSLKSW